MGEGRAARPPAVPERVPADWYLVPAAIAPAPGEVTAAVLAGEDLVLWRGPDGALVAQDAYCPHFGAHLGHGGLVEDGCLRCPFHGWRWAPDGRHAGYPMGDGVASVRLPTYETRRDDDGEAVRFGPTGAA